MIDHTPKAWIVGSAFGRNDDQTARFLEQGLWEISDPSEVERQMVRTMQSGDRIAIKSTFVQKHKLPFANHGQPVSVLRLKARGTILANPGDGVRIEVNWDKGFEARDWYFYTFRGTIWQLSSDSEDAKRLLRFVFEDEPQDCSWFLAQPYWREKYQPAAERLVPSVWVEKTLVTGRADREHGDHALGKALWSPQKSKSGGDIYANMRRVQPGDLILHLTDNRGFTGMSVATEIVDDTFQGVAGTEWEGECFRILLHNFEELDPPLLRDQLLRTQPYASELKELIDSGAKGLFFNRNLELNQGAYLTEATPTLLSIISRAYLDVSGKRLPIVGFEEPSEARSNVAAAPYSIEDALETLFLDRSELEDTLLLWKAKKNLILQGPPGVGKSYASQKLAFALIEEADRDRVGFVQFHQSYSYEDFVEGFRPTDKGFELKAGKFVQFCRKAEAVPSNRYVFVIDEINRGNLSKILGELMLLIEGDKRGPEWAMPLASGNVAFHVPPNLFLLGLMNTADRSLAVVDYALRRRFAFLDLKPKIGSDRFLAHLAANGIGSELSAILVSRIGSLNNEIVADTLNLGPGFAIGHSFFCSKPMTTETERSWLKRVLKTEIIPLLREYWYDSAHKADEWESRLLEGL